MALFIKELRDHGAGGVTLRFGGPSGEWQQMVWYIKALQVTERQWMPQAFGIGGWWLSAWAWEKVRPAFTNAERWRRNQEEEPRAPPPHPVIPVRVEQAFSLLHLRPTAPSWLIERVRRFLAERVHPDRGGNLQEMQRVNAAADVALAWARQQHRAA